MATSTKIMFAHVASFVLLRTCSGSIGSMKLDSRKSTISLPVGTMVPGAEWLVTSWSFSFTSFSSSADAPSGADIGLADSPTRVLVPWILLNRSISTGSVATYFLGKRKLKVTAMTTPVPHEVTLPATAFVVFPVLVTSISPDSFQVATNQELSPAARPIQGAAIAAVVDCVSPILVSVLPSRACFEIDIDLLARF